VSEGNFPNRWDTATSNGGQRDTVCQTGDGPLRWCQHLSWPAANTSLSASSNFLPSKGM
ncbi:hypothetical protein SK128_011311, partial [Halocaridina rubra]